MSDPVQQIALSNSPAPTGGPAVTAASAVASAIQTVSNTTSRVAESAVSESQIARAVETLNEVLKERDISLRFEKNETLNRFIVEVVDQNTGERVLQVPNDEVIHAVENIDRLRGILFSREV